MGFKGRYLLGQEMHLDVQCRDVNFLPVVPDDCPVIKVWNAANVAVVNQKIPVSDRYNTTGYFQMSLFLGMAFAVGLYTVTYTYTQGGNRFAECDNFEVVAGGDSSGSVEAMYFWRKPQGDFIVYELSSGVLAKGRNPSMI